MKLEEKCMRTEFGLSVPVKSTLVWGCRGLIKGTNPKKVDVPFDRAGFWSASEISMESRKEFVEKLQKLDPITNFVEKDIRNQGSPKTGSTILDGGFVCDYMWTNGYIYISVYNIVE